jgi:hypothetical protein
VSYSWYTAYKWRGEPIHDIKAWASQRGERMVKYRATRYVPSLLTGQLEKETYTDEMPESFWYGLLVPDGWHYEEIE